MFNLLVGKVNTNRWMEKGLELKLKFTLRKNWIKLQMEITFTSKVQLNDTTTRSLFVSLLTSLHATQTKYSASDNLLCKILAHK